MGRPSGIVIAATLALLSLIWGTTWAAIRIGLRGVPPFTGVALRFGIAAVALFVLGRLLGVPLGRSRPERLLWIVNGLLSFCGSYGIVYWSEQWVPSGLASVLFATFPLFVAVLAHFALPDEPLRAATVAGIVVGFGGVALIFSEDFAKLGGQGVAFASGVMLVSPFVSAVANVAIKRWGKGLHHLSLTTVPMAIAAVVMGAAAVGVERGRPIVWSGAALGALLYLALAGSALTFSLYYWLLEHLPATRVSLVAYTAPVVAVTVGAIFMNEPYTLRTLAGSALVLGGVGLCAGPFRRVRARTAASLVLVAIVSRAGAADGGPLRIPADPSPAAVRAFGSLDGLVALALTDDGQTAAAAFGIGEGNKRRTLLRVAGGPQGLEPRETEVDGIVRALRFGPGGKDLYALVARINVKRGTGAVAVVSYDLATLRESRSARVPLSAKAMDLTSDATALLIACRDELRVLLVPELRSPRLYGLPGDNGSIAVVPGGDRVLVGRDDALVLVNLSDRQSRAGLPVGAQVAAGGSVVALATSPDGSAALGRLIDGRTLRITLDPLRVEDAGVSTVIAWTGARIPYAPPVPPAPAPASAPASVPASVPPPAPPPPAATTIAPPPAEASPPATLAVEEVPVPAASAPATVLEVAPPAAPAESDTREPSATSPSATVPGPFVRGRITGSARSRVTHVVLYGPDSLIHEAARVVPGADGAWSAGPLPLGAYRVVLDAGGSHTVLSEPPFGRVVLQEGAGVEAPDMLVLRVMIP